MSGREKLGTIIRDTTDSCCSFDLDDQIHFMLTYCGMSLNLKALLNRQQAEAASSIDGPLLIIAGAGSGKTRMITYRIANMLDKGIDEKNILALTFTNKAAREMSERVRDVTKEKLKNLTTTTFHSFGLTLLKKYIHHLGYHNNFSLYDSNDNQALIKNSIISLGYQIPDYNVSTLLSLFSDVKTGRKPLNEEESAVKEIYNEWLLSQKAYNVVDFDDLILLPIRIFEKKQFVLEEVQERYRYILVDEFQDTSLLQYKMISMIAKKYRNIAVVGDDDQSIYSWRGANYENILNFEKDFPERKEFKLEQNYRSSRTILDAANAVIRHNEERKDKALWTDSTEGAEITLCHHESGEEEASFIAEDIRKRFRSGAKFSDFGILVRTNSLMSQIENSLLESSIPHRISGGQSFYERREIRDMLCYLKVLVNEKDDVSLLRIINTPRRGIGRTTIEKIRSYADKNFKSLSEAVDDLVLSDTISDRTRKALSDFKAQLQKWRAIPDISRIISTIAEDIKYRNMLYEEYPDKPKTVDYKMMGINILSDRIKRYLEKNPDATLNDYITLTALVNDEDEENDDKVSLMTMHASKGLEFNVVYIAGMEDDIIPSKRSLEENPDNIFEERRLFYVAITRARKELIINNARTRTNSMGESRTALPSRFLEEIPSELLKNEDELKKETMESNINDLRSLLNKYKNK